MPLSDPIAAVKASQCTCFVHAHHAPRIEFAALGVMPLWMMPSTTADAGCSLGMKRPLLVMPHAAPQPDVLTQRDGNDGSESGCTSTISFEGGKYHGIEEGWGAPRGYELAI